jgi:hypothetical protein
VSLGKSFLVETVDISTKNQMKVQNLNYFLPINNLLPKKSKTASSPLANTKAYVKFSFFTKRGKKSQEQNLAALSPYLSMKTTLLCHYVTHSVYPSIISTRPQ